MLLAVSVWIQVLVAFIRSMFRSLHKHLLLHLAEVVVEMCSGIYRFPIFGCLNVLSNVARVFCFVGLLLLVVVMVMVVVMVG